MPRDIDKTPIRIHDWHFDPEAKTLRKSDGHLVRLEDKIAHLLHTFCKHRGDVISKEDIITQVWGGRELSEQTIPVAISKLRKALGDDINQPRMLETLPRQGYRLLDERQEDKTAGLATKHSRYFSRRATLIASTVMLIIAVFSVIYIRYLSAPTLDRIQLVNAEKPGLIITINDVRTTEATKENIDQAIGISELSSYYLAQVPDILVIRHWWNIDAPDPTGGIYTRYGAATPVYSLKATLLRDGDNKSDHNIVTFILSEPRTDEVLWTGLHKVADGSEQLFATLGTMLNRLSVGQGTVAAPAPNEDMRYWNARYFMQLSNARAAKTAYKFINDMSALQRGTAPRLPMETALLARWREQLAVDNPALRDIDLQDDMLNADTHIYTSAVDAAAIALYRDDDPQAAIQILEGVLQKVPGDHYAYSLWAEAKEHTGNRQQAIDAYKKAIRLAPYARAYKARLEQLEGTNETHGNNSE